jgi:hypothetical protein
MMPRARDKRRSHMKTFPQRALNRARCAFCGERAENFSRPGLTFMHFDA